MYDSPDFVSYSETKFVLFETRPRSRGTPAQASGESEDLTFFAGPMLESVCIEMRKVNTTRVLVELGGWP